MRSEGVIGIGEKVVCWDVKGTGNVTLKTINPDGSKIITMHLWDNDVDYKSIAAAKMAHWEPALDSYNHKCLSDGIPQYKKNEMYQFHHQRNEISMNKKYHTTLCHTLYPR